MNIDLTGQIRRARDAVRMKAAESVKSGDKEAAATNYEQAASLTLQLADATISRKVELQLKREALQYREIARRLRNGDALPTAAGGKGDATRNAEGGSTEGGGATGEFEGVVNSMVHTSTLTWDDIGGLETTKSDIKYTLGVSLARPPEGVTFTLWRNILFYGPPGTGKTLLAAATSSALKTERGQALFFNVKVSSVMSKYFGESTRIISEIYGTARDHSPAVVFLDEFESLTPKRNDEATGPERRILSTILAELDGLSEKGRTDAFVLTVAATNRPWDIDPAVLSRFEKKILIPLPDATTRERILRILIERRGLKLQGPLIQLVQATAGFSGREIERVFKEALGRMVASMNANLPALVDKGLDQVRGYQMQVRPLTLEDFDVALKQMKPATSEAEMTRYRDWKEETE
ncbi:MAG: 26S protease regulatory subunit [Planctomycetota bacterium]